MTRAAVSVPALARGVQRRLTSAARGGAREAHPRAPDAPAGLARGTDTTLTQQLTQRFAEGIRQRLLAPGTRLPSVRECARVHAVSPHTVVAAYDQLQARGLVEARRQRGFFVRAGEERSGTSARRADPAGTPRPLPNSATALIRAMFQAPGGRPMPGFGTLPAEWLDAPLLGAAMRRATTPRQTATSALQYGDPAGELRLRAALATKIADFG